jgi:hypothetical protein
VLLTPQPGRLNSAAEVARELALRQRQLRVVDGLYFHSSAGRNVGPEHLFDDGRVVFARFRLPIRNGTDVLAYFVEYVHRGEHNRFGSLLNRPSKGTGAGCSAFAMGSLQAARVVPFVAEPPPQTPSADTVGIGPFWRSVHATVHIPWRHLACDERVGAAAIHPTTFCSMARPPSSSATPRRVWQHASAPASASCRLDAIARPGHRREAEGSDGPW